MSKFGWSLPAGCTMRHIEEAFGDNGDDTVCAWCGVALPDNVADDSWQFSGLCDAICAVQYGLQEAKFDDRVWHKSAQDEFKQAVRELIAIAKKEN